MNCFLCQKHEGIIAPPPGGYILDGECWKICHAPVDRGPLGTLIIESSRHFLDFAQANPDELAEYGPLLKQIYTALKTITKAERIYQLIILEGVPHFHAWLMPRKEDDEERGVSFINKDASCEYADVENLVAALRTKLMQ